MPPTRELDAYERRVLGALMEKEQTTPDQYPLTVNALIAACNQKTNRDPVTKLTETEVVEALDRLRLDVLTWRVEGARVERWEHRLERRWHLTPARKALMTLLLLRGPQTVGELKTRTERMHPFPSVAAVEETLKGMTGGLDALVRELPRQPGKRENRWTHIMASEDPGAEELVAAAPVAPAAAPPPTASAAPRGPSAMDRLEALEAELGTVRGEVEELRGELLALRRRLGDLED
ncbi:MAG: YceH family protein [Acidobacteriota bacterium]